MAELAALVAKVEVVVRVEAEEVEAAE